MPHRTLGVKRWIGHASCARVLCGSFCHPSQRLPATGPDGRLSLKGLKGYLD